MLEQRHVWQTFAPQDVLNGFLQSNLIEATMSVTTQIDRQAMYSAKDLARHLKIHINAFLHIHAKTAKHDCNDSVKPWSVKFE